MNLHNVEILLRAFFCILNVAAKECFKIFKIVLLKINKMFVFTKGKSYLGVKNVGSQ